MIMVTAGSARGGSGVRYLVGEVTLGIGNKFLFAAVTAKEILVTVVVMPVLAITRYFHTTHWIDGSAGGKVLHWFIHYLFNLSGLARN